MPQNEKVYTVRLFRIRSVHGNLRTDIVEGVTNELPKMDTNFVLYGDSLDFVGGGRLVRTTPVLEMVSLMDGTLLFRTKNSTYCLGVEDQPKEESKNECGAV